MMWLNQANDWKKTSVFRFYYSVVLSPKGCKIASSISYPTWLTLKSGVNKFTVNLSVVPCLSFFVSVTFTCCVYAITSRKCRSPPCQISPI